MGRWLVVLCVLVSSLTAGMVALQRVRVEQSNRAVELVLDYPDVAQWASAEGKTVAEWLRRFDTPFSVALTEETLADWGVPVPASSPTYLLSEARFHQAKRMLALKARVELEPPPDTPAVEIRSEHGARFWVVGDEATVRQIGLGLDPLQMEQVRAGGKPVVARLLNPQGITPLALRGSLLLAREQGATLLIFAGDQVLGYRRGLEATAQSIRANAQRFGALEFAKQMGTTHLTLSIPDRTVRVHSIGLAESLPLTPNEIVERLERAVQERNIRVVYLRAAGADTALLREILQDLTRRLHRSGYTIRESGARPFDALQPAWWQYALIGLGVGVLIGWLVATIRPQGLWRFAPIVLGVAFAGLCLHPHGRKIAALMAALLFPTVGIVALASIVGRPQPHSLRGAANVSLFNLAALIPLPFAWSLLGALHIVGLLSETPFLIKADQFAGVKLAHALPLLLVLGFYAARSVGRWDFWRDWLARPVLWGQVALALVILGALGFMLVRTGNEAPGAVPDWELRLRALLETVMNVRPRTKEFLIGHPALVIAIAMLLSGQTRWAPLAMFLAAIGQVSIVNTFCHLHSPLLVSLQRTGWGILIGVGLGLMLLALWKAIDHRRTRPGESDLH
ncbi:MAG: hypothetical protein KatS3mg016_2075 [Fimbriimonadales bacterium]|nr:MAG: hypothetical protein KatS3mg016_2075 [Fimbriimonadales bacterium]